MSSGIKREFETIKTALESGKRVVYDKKANNGQGGFIAVTRSEANNLAKNSQYLTQLTDVCNQIEAFINKNKDSLKPTELVALEAALDKRANNLESRKTGFLAKIFMSENDKQLIDNRTKELRNTKNKVDIIAKQIQSHKTPVEPPNVITPAAPSPIPSQAPDLPLPPLHENKKETPKEKPPLQKSTTAKEGPTARETEEKETPLQYKQSQTTVEESTTAVQPFIEEEDKKEVPEEKPLVQESITTKEGPTVQETEEKEIPLRYRQAQTTGEEKLALAQPSVEEVEDRQTPLDQKTIVGQYHKVQSYFCMQLERLQALSENPEFNALLKDPKVGGVALSEEQIRSLFSHKEALTGAKRYLGGITMLVRVAKKGLDITAPYEVLAKLRYPSYLNTLLSAAQSTKNALDDPQMKRKLEAVEEELRKKEQNLLPDNLSLEDLLKTTLQNPAKHEIFAARLSDSALEDIQARNLEFNNSL